MAWTQLFFAALFEVAWAIGITFTDGFTKLWPSLGVVVATLASFALLALALRRIALGTAYAVWSGIGAAGTALCGALLLGEPLTFWRVVSLCAIIAGVLGLKLLHDPTPTPAPAKVEPS
ncbi:MAG: multidrug efflux SMR transporter [Phycisphaerales bacterium]|nr:multidrug efflux SMR transporter [Phycisphaerales bacterium]